MPFFLQTCIQTSNTPPGQDCSQLIEKVFTSKTVLFHLLLSFQTILLKCDFCQSFPQSLWHSKCKRYFLVLLLSVNQNIYWAPVCQAWYSVLHAYTSAKFLKLMMSVVAHKLWKSTQLISEAQALTYSLLLFSLCLPSFLCALIGSTCVVYILQYWCWQDSILALTLCPWDAHIC